LLGGLAADGRRTSPPERRAGPLAPSPALAAAAAPAAPAPSWGKPGLNFLAALAPEQAEVAVLALPGLRNESGEFNCFLNVVLQVHHAYESLFLPVSWLASVSALMSVVFAGASCLQCFVSAGKR